MNILQVMFKSKLQLLEENQQLRFAYDRMAKRVSLLSDMLDEEHQLSAAHLILDSEKKGDFSSCPKDY